MRITLQETTKLMNEIANQKGWTDLSLGLIRETCRQINAGDGSYWALLVAQRKSELDEQAELESFEAQRLKRVAEITAKARKMYAKNADQNARRVRLYQLLMSEPKHTAQWYAIKLGIPTDYVSKRIHNWVRSGIVIKQASWGRKFTYRLAGYGFVDIEQAS